MFVNIKKFQDLVAVRHMEKNILIPQVMAVGLNNEISTLMNIISWQQQMLQEHVTDDRIEIKMDGGDWSNKQLAK